MSRVLIIDGQVFQTPALFRGMGKYTNELAQALYDLNHTKQLWDKIEVIISSQIQTDYNISDELYGWYTAVEVVCLDTKPNKFRTNDTSTHNRSVVDGYITKSHPNDEVDFLIPAIFQSEICAVFPSLPNVHGVQLIHDLIPLKFHEIYLKDPEIRHEYLTKFSECLRAHSFVTVSQTVANDFCLRTGVDMSRVHPILGGPIKHGRASKPIDVKKPFILVTSGNDVRKNNRRAVQGFDIFNKNHNNEYELVLTSFFQPQEIDELSGLCSNVNFVGNISGEQLNYLYENCSSLLFPTEDEGLGLPILEAIERDKPVVCSDIPVFREMSDDAFCIVDYTSSDSIAAGLEESLNKKTAHDINEAILERFSWPETAKRLYEHMRAIDDRGRMAATSAPIAVVCPDPSYSKIGEYAQVVLSEMAYLQPDYQCFVAEERLKTDNIANYLSYLFPTCHSTPWDLSPKDDYLPVYFVDDSTGAASVVSRALQRPGVLILGSDNIKSVWEDMKLQKYVSASRYELEVLIDKRIGLLGTMLGSLINCQKQIYTLDKKLSEKLENIAKSKNLEWNIQTLPHAKPTIPVPKLIGYSNDIESSPRYIAREIGRSLRWQKQ